MSKLSKIILIIFLISLVVCIYLLFAYAIRSGDFGSENFFGKFGQKIDVGTATGNQNNSYIISPLGENMKPGDMFDIGRGEIIVLVGTLQKVEVSEDILVNIILSLNDEKQQGFVLSNVINEEASISINTINGTRDLMPNDSNLIKSLGYKENVAVKELSKHLDEKIAIFIPRRLDTLLEWGLTQGTQAEEDAKKSLVECNNNYLNGGYAEQTFEDCKPFAILIHVYEY